jgi:NADH-quinone oxidoreductase subunit H
MHPRILHLLSLIVVCFGLMTFVSACANDTPPNTLNVLDFQPREADVGDRLEVIGTNFPVKRAAIVNFDGYAHRPGAEPVVVHVQVDAESTSAERIDLPFSERLSEEFCGLGDKAIHTTFRGTVTVKFPSTDGGPPLIGAVKNVVFDLRPPTARRFALSQAEDNGREALKFMGIEIAPNSPAAGGLLVANVKPGGKADMGGLRPWDVITEVDGVHVASVADAAPAGGTVTSLGVRRPNEPEMRYVQVSLDGYKQTIPADLLGAGLVVGIASAILLLFMAPTAGIITWVERRVSARMQSRIGPNRAGPGGFVVWLADGIKSIMKEDIIPTESDNILFRLAPYLVFMGVSATFVVMPFGQKLIAADLDIGILYIIAITSLVTIGLLTAGWASNNKWSLLGGIRAAAQIISYEIPGAVAVVCIVMMTGSLRLQDIIAAQGGMPWDWYMFRNPITFLLFFLYFTTALAEGNRAPFDLPEAESELVAGYSTEYSGMRYLFFFFAEWANVFVMSGIATALFLGGWQLPFVSPMQQEGSMALQAMGAMVFLTKAWILVFVIVWIRWTLPRVRIDQMMNMCWKYFVPFSFFAFIATALWLVAQPPQWFVTVSGAVMFTIWVVILGYFFSRVRYNLKTVSTHHLDPYV